MFTIEQIEAAHSKVKSGADFPKYIQAIKQLGVNAFETWVVDSHTEYFGKDGYQTKSQPMYEKLDVADKSDKNKFSNYLKIHHKAKPITAPSAAIARKQVLKDGSRLLTK